MRETLFNWLLAAIAGARCLDLFAGSGALGFEALSRGARRAVLVEQNKLLARQLEASRAILDADRAEVVCAEAISWLARRRGPFDIVFLDPPFRLGYVEKACTLLINKGHLASAAHVYTETERDAPEPGPGLQTIKRAQAGQVEYRLYQYHIGECE